MKLKAMGVIPGVPDLFLLWHGVFHVFECKTETGKLSNDQKELHALWAYHSTHVTVFRSLEEFKPLFEAIVTAATPATSSL